MLNPNEYDVYEQVMRRRRLLRGIFLAIIIGTLPFYCLGFFLWGAAPDLSAQRNQTPTATNTAIGADESPTPGATSTSIVTTTPFPTLPNTPTNFVPPVVTRFLSPTPFFPTDTAAPTLTFPPPTLTPVPTDTPQPPTPTVTPPTPLPPPSDTPPPTIPTEAPTATEPPLDTGSQG